MNVPTEPRTRLCRPGAVAVALMTVLLPAEHLLAQSTRAAIPAVIRSVQVEAGPDGSTTVIVQATTALPEPSSGVAETPPPRIYLDFTDVLPDPNLQPVVSTAAVKAVRVAEHSASPLVTRVVINLVKATTYRVESSGRAQGRIAILLGEPSSDRGKATSAPTGSVKPSAPTTSTAPSPTTPASPPTSATAQPSPPPAKTPSAGGQQPPAAGQPPHAAPATPNPQSSAQPPGSRGRSNAAETQYGVRISSALVRLHALRPLLEAIDRRADPIPGDLDAPAAEFDSIGQLLSGIKPPPSRQGTHALLLRTCTFGARAVRIRQEANATKDAAKGWDAASAAAGAMMMFDKANEDLAK